MATSKNSSTLFRCDPQCTTADPFVWSSASSKYVCASPSTTARQWGDGLRVQCIAWMPASGYAYAVESALVSGNNAFSGGIQLFGTSSTTAENMIYAAGSYRGVLTETTSWLWWASADASAAGRGLIYAFPGGVQIVGPIAYNERLRRVFVPVQVRAVFRNMCKRAQT